MIFVGCIDELADVIGMYYSARAEATKQLEVRVKGLQYFNKYHMIALAIKFKNIKKLQMAVKR